MLGLGLGRHIGEQPTQHRGHVVHQREGRQQRAARRAAFRAGRHDQHALGEGQRRPKGLPGLGFGFGLGLGLGLEG